MNILHIVPDDKFIDELIEFFCQIKNTTNKYVCIIDDLKSNNYQFQYIRQVDRVDILAVSKTTKLWRDNSIDLYIFHSLPEWMYNFVLSIPKSKKIFWSSWGFDIYTTSLGIKPILPLEIYKPITQRLYDSLYLPKTSALTVIKRKIKYLINYKGYREQELQKKVITNDRILFRQHVLERIDYMSTVLPIEYNMLSKIPGFRAKYVPFQYTSKSTDNMPIRHLNNGSYILLGNSADFSNNHIDVLKILRMRSIKNIVYMPMAYGDNVSKQCIKNNLKSTDNVLLQEEFIPMEAYMKILGNCKVAIFGHIRQQALGNIRIAMQYGMKVFFYKDSVCYKYFKDNGFVVYSIEGDLYHTSIDQTMNPDDIVTNVKKLNDIYAYDNVLQRTQIFFNTIN